MSEKRKRCTALTAEFKQKVIKAAEENSKIKKNPKEFNIPASTLVTIIRSEEKYEFGSGRLTMCKRTEPGELKDVYECVLKWLRQCRDIWAPVQQEKVETIYGKIRLYVGFRLSNSWLKKFQKNKFEKIVRKKC